MGLSRDWKEALRFLLSQKHFHYQTQNFLQNEAQNIKRSFWFSKCQIHISLPISIYLSKKYLKSLLTLLTFQSLYHRCVTKGKLALIMLDPSFHPAESSDYLGLLLKYQTLLPLA